MTRLTACGLAVVLVAAVGWAADPPKAEVVKATKPACALVDTPKGYGSAFCVDPAGYFVTNEHVVGGMGKGSKLKLVLGAGEKDQAVLDAVVVRSDKAADLALLKVDGKADRPSLTLGDDQTVSELDEVIGFGFPFGTALSKTDDYPGISVSAGSVSSLRRDKDRKLDRIQLDGALNPGNSGGPVLNRKGEVVGVVVSGIRGTGLTQAIPVSHVRLFLEQPEITLVAAVVEAKDKHQKAAVRAQVFAVARPGELTVELTVASGGRERRVPMTAKDGGYEAAVAPFDDGPPPPVQADIRYPDGVVRIPVADAPVTVGGKGYTLSQLRKVTPGKPAVVVLADGTTVSGELTGLDRLAAAVGGQKAEFTTATAAELTFLAPPAEGGRYKLTAVARRGGKEVGRAEVVKYLKGTEPGGVEGLMKGHFTKPPQGAKARTSAVLVSAAGDPLGKGKKYEFTETQVRADGVTGGGVVVTFQAVEPDGKPVAQFRPGFTLQLFPPKGEALDAREYPGAASQGVRADIAPQIDFFTGGGGGYKRASGKFVVWEVELQQGVVRKLALDFIIYPDDNPETPLVGVIRYNSKSE